MLILLFVALFLSDGLFGPDLAVFGVRDRKTEQEVLQRYGLRIVWTQVKLLAFMMGIGFLWGWLCKGLIFWWERATSKGRWPRYARNLSALCLGLLAHLACLSLAIVQRPALYVESLYQHPGWRKIIMYFLTHQLPHSALLGFWIGLAAFLLLFPLCYQQGRAQIKAFFSSWVRRVVAGGALVVAAGCCCAFFLHSSPPKSVASAKKPPSVLFIAIDSLRADKIGNQATQISPNLSQLAQRSVQFDAAFVSLPRTFPSFATLLTGRYSHHHGIRTMFPSPADRAAVGPTLPKFLQQQGYRTHVISDFAGEIFARIDLGFQDRQVPVFDAGSIVEQRNITVHPSILPYVTETIGRKLFPSLNGLAELSDPRRLTEQAMRVLETHAKDQQPFFMTVFYSTAHFPYAAAQPAYRKFTDPLYQGPYLYHKPPLTKDITPEDAKHIQGLYDGAVWSVDAQIGRLLQALQQQGLDQDTIVVVLSDHGEFLYDRPAWGMGHGDHLEGRQAVQIPLLVHDPIHRFPAHHVSGIVRDIDLSPTLLSLLDQPAAALPVDGVPLLPLLRNEATALNLSSFAETELWFTETGPGFAANQRIPYPGILGTVIVTDDDDIYLKDEWKNTVIVGKHRSLRTERHKLIYRPTRHGILWSLYDLQLDPDEQHDVAADPAYHTQLLNLQNQLLAWIAQDPNTTLVNGYVQPVLQNAK